MQEEMAFVAELGMLRSVAHPHLLRYLGCGIHSEKQPDGTTPTRYLAIVCPRCSPLSYPPSPPTADTRCRGWEGKGPSEGQCAPVRTGAMFQSEHAF